MERVRTVLGTILSVLLLLASAASAQTQSTSTVTFEDLAREWKGEIQVDGAEHGLTVKIRKDGKFTLSVPTNNHESEGKITVRDGKITWWNYTSNVSGVMTFSREDGKLLLRGSRHDGTRPFTWWAEDK